MIDGTEQIEAKLAAYVDGELSDVERAEIELHLQKNPAHRELLAELMEQRQWLAQLPRDAAPADVSEAIHGQLERSVLLDGAGEEETATLKINRWPQVMALAAMLLLATGLGLIVYYVLPSPGTQPPEFARTQNDPSLPSLSRAAEDPENETVTDRPGDRLGKAGEIANRDNSALVGKQTELGDNVFAKPMGDVRSGGGVSNATENQLALPGRQHLDNRALNQDPLFQQIVTQGARLNGNPTMVILLETDDPTLANGGVTQFFESNGIAWSNRTEPMPEALNLSASQTTQGSRFNDRYPSDTGNTKNDSSHTTKKMVAILEIILSTLLGERIG